MARKIIWSLPAIEDVNVIYEYINRDSPLYADKLIDELIEKVDLLTSFPDIGRILPEFNNDFLREIFVKQYRVIYKAEENRITILGMIHMARDFYALWKNR